jgi:glycosyltransferase involved in cell wall biosynthesis
MITVTMTTGKRLALLKRTIQTFVENCLDIDLISRWVVSDDGSTDSDISEMKKEFPFLEIYKNPNHGHASNLNNLFSIPTTQYVYQLEDDWLFIKKGHYIKDSLAVMFNNRDIKMVRTNCIKGDVLNVVGVNYIRHEFDIEWRKKGQANWETLSFFPPFTLNPGLQHLPSLLSIGKFGQLPKYEPHLPSGFETDFAYQYWLKGFRMATLTDTYCQHIGGVQSLYDLNQTNRIQG